MKTAVYPGSFDPVTNGHLDIIRRAAKIFDKVVVSVFVNKSKNSAFSVEERINMLKAVTAEFDNVEIIQISQEAGQVVRYSHLLKNFPQFIVIHTVKGFGIVNKAEIDVFLELSCFYHDPADVGNLISGSSAFSKTSLNIWEVHGSCIVEAWLRVF